MKIELTYNEAIVLTELLKRFSQEDMLGIEDQAEQRALWNLECVLEKSVGDCFEGDWPQALRTARDAIRDEGKTSASQEKSKGRLALWLDPTQIKFLLDEWRSLPKDCSADKLKSWGEIAFLASSALHKAGIDSANA